MSLKFSMDIHVHGAITRGLRLRGVDVLTAQEDGADEWDDDVLLDRAGALDRLMVTQDQDFLREAAGRQVAGEPFIGVIFGHQSTITISQAIQDLQLIAEAGTAEEFADRVTYLPYR